MKDLLTNRTVIALRGILARGVRSRAGAESGGHAGRAVLYAQAIAHGGVVRAGERGDEGGVSVWVCGYVSMWAQRSEGAGCVLRETLAGLFSKCLLW